MEITPTATCCAAMVDQWIRDGVRHAVVCPGSRSTPMALALAERSELTLHVHHDERSAAFLALGIGVSTGMPAIVLTTSGTAAVELHPAVVEASYAGVPLVACTADRPPELQGVGAPQTIDQAGLYSSAVRDHVSVPVPDAAEAMSWRGYARRAVEASLADPGPVQVNLHYREPLVGSPGLLPPPLEDRPIEARPVASLPLDDLSGRRGIVVVGGGTHEPDAVWTIAAGLGWPVLADPRSGCRRPGAIAHADPILRVPEFAEAHRPEVILRFGALPSSRVVTEWIAGSGAFEIVVADRVDDPSGTVAHRTAGDLRDLVAAVGSLDAAPVEWLERWTGAQMAAEDVISAAVDGGETTEPAAARCVVGAVPDGSVIVTSSSMPVRDVEWFSAPRDGVTIVANRGANGIDGVTSTAAGIAATGRPTTVVVGDLAFLHDTNGLLGLSGRGLDLTIVVIDNRGGGIFSFLPQARVLPSERFEQLFGTPHDVDLPALARAHGLRVVEAATIDELRSAASDCSGTKLVMVRTDRRLNVAHHDALNQAVASALTGR